MPLYRGWAHAAALLAQAAALLSLTRQAEHIGNSGPPGFLFERLSLSLFLLNNCGFKNYGCWDVRMQSIHSQRCPEIETVFFEGAEA